MLKTMKKIWDYITEPNMIYLDYPGAEHVCAPRVEVELKVDVTDCMDALNKVIEADKLQKFQTFLFTPEYQMLTEERLFKFRKLNPNASA